ncbi:MAG: hypothetical protein UT58_C0019G0006 [Microgenomates group bacterium GW2011_GWC1_39_7b]|nr:MAG: hypothetical protein UT58_C0019G0006 [Microgenomates group bacterium GW2011_GWC1_39_7b]
MHYKESPTENEKKAFAPVLAEDEELILATGLGRAYLRSKFIVGIMWPGGIFIVLALALFYFAGFNLSLGILAGLALGAVFSMLHTMHVYHANRYLLTTRRVIIKQGIFAVKLTSALFDKITHIEVEQSFLDKLVMKHGTIIVNTAGMNKAEIALKYVDYPIELKNLLERLINREREQYGRGVGPITTLEGEVLED